MRFIVLALSLCSAIGVSAQEEIWENYTTGLYITAIGSNDETVWVGMYGGLAPDLLPT